MSAAVVVLTKSLIRGTAPVSPVVPPVIPVVVILSLGTMFPDASLTLGPLTISPVSRSL